MRPIRERLIVRPLPTHDPKSPIIIPEIAQEKPQQGTVLSTGPGVRLPSGKYVEPQVSVGQVVLFGKHSGTPTRIDHEDVLILSEHDVLAVVL